MTDGNADQLRFITDQLAEQVAARAIEKFAEEHPEDRTWGRTKLEWGVILSIMTSAACLIFTGGFVYGQVQANSREIARLRDEGDKTTDRLARIETKVDILVEAKTGKAP